MDAPTATILAALSAASASLITLLLKTRTEWHAELRATNRKKLEAFVDDLGDAIHRLIACCVLRARDQRTSNRTYWTTQIEATRAVLRRLRPRLRYQLWGLDEGLKTLICLPDWSNDGETERITALLDSASRLRQSLDQAIRRCYQQGRTPNYFERLQVQRRATATRLAARNLGFDRSTEEQLLKLQYKSRKEHAPKQYPKTYATILEVSDEEFVAQTDAGPRVKVRKANRSGRGSRSHLRAGMKVKLYQRDEEDFYRYRFVGG